MVHYKAFLAIALTVASVNGAPLMKRIAQVIADSTTKWEAACKVAGGGLQCNPVAVASFGTLLAAPGPCEQQDAADKMIDLAKTLKNDPNMIKFTQIFAQQPRNSPNSLSVPYCQKAPKNAELNGLFQCQYQGDNPKVFVGGGAPGSSGTIPFGMSRPLSPAGSCKAHPSGPIKDGTQLTDITSDPGVGSGSASSNMTSTKTKSSTATSKSTKHKGSSKATASTKSSLATDAVSKSTSVDCSKSSTATAAGNTAVSPSPAIINLNNPSNSPSVSATSPPIITLLSSASVAAHKAAASGSASSGSFHLQNGLKAQKLNAQFSKLTTSSSCTEGEQACVNKGFAQCVGGKFVVTQCAASTICAALPLVNSPGTSIACTTQSDALARIKATGATMGLTGSGA